MLNTKLNSLGYPM